MKKTAVNRVFMLLVMAMVLLMVTVASALAEDYSASTIRLLHYEGDVEVEDANGNPRFVVENIRFASGEAVITGADSTASVSLDSSKILTLDQDSRVQFQQSGNAMTLTLTNGTLLLDVQEKLDENETLDIQTSTMVVGIRGTVVYVSDQPADDNTLTIEGVNQVLDTEWANNAGRVTTIGVMEGTANISFVNQSGQPQVMQVPAGFKATMVDNNQDGLADIQPEQSQLTAQDIAGFVATQVQSDPLLTLRINDACDVLDQMELYPADGDWVWTGTVTLVAQSASKMYDGTPLTRFGGVLVYNLPQDFSIEVYANGSRTEAGEADNPIGGYAIYNAKGENVTAHFPHIEKVSGTLVVDPAPVTVWTGSASKTYDGTPLTNNEAMLRTAPGYEYGDPTWRNTSTVVSESDGGEALYGLSGMVLAHGTNPLTGETTEIPVKAGEKMSVYLSDSDNGQTIEFKVEKVSEYEIPEELLRVYAANPDLLTQACADANWDISIIQRRIAELPQLENKATVQQDGLAVSAEDKDRMMRDFTNVRIAIDSDITDYSDRPLDSNEAHYTRVDLDQSVVITATGSQTDVGESYNTYVIDWGEVNPKNYILTDDLGKLTVYPCDVSFEMSYGSTAFTGAPILPDKVVAVLPNGTRVEGVLVLASASPVSAPSSFVRYFSLPGAKVMLECEGYTNVGTYTVVPTITFLSGRDYNYDISFTGNTITIGASDVTLELGGSTAVTYDGAFHGGAPAVTTASGSATVTQTGDATWSVAWPWGGASTLAIAGGGVNAGEYALTGSLDNADNLNVVLTGETLTITPLDVTLDLGGGSRAYTGEEYSGNLTVSCASATPEVTKHTVEIIADCFDTYWSIQWPWGDTQDLCIGCWAADGDEWYFASPCITGSYTLAYVPYDADSYTLAYEWGTEVTSNYNFTAANTALTITPIQLTVTVHPKDEYVYGDAFFIWADDSDGFITASTTPETDVQAVAIEGAWEIKFLDFDIFVQPALEGELYHNYLNVKAGENSIQAVLYPLSDDNPFYSGDPTNVDITFETATFNVLPLDITIDLGGGTYDLGGEPNGPSVTFNNGDWAEETEAFEGYEYDEVTGTYSYSMAMPGGDTLFLDITPNETGDFTYTLDHSVLILDYDETDKSGNYTIAYANETLEFEYSEDAVTLYGGSAEKTFDGTALTNDEITFEGLPDGYTVTGTCSGSQTDAGENENDVADYQIWDADGNDKTEYFINVSTVPGTLTVNPLPVTISMTNERYPYRGVYQGVNVQITCDNTNYTLTGEEWTRDDEYNHWHLVWDWGDQLDFDINGGLNVGTYTCSIGEVTASSGNLENYSITTGDSVTKTIYALSIGINLSGPMLSGPYGSQDVYSYKPWTSYINGPYGGSEFEAYDSWIGGENMMEFYYTLFTGDELKVTYDASDLDKVGTHQVTYTATFLTGDPNNYAFSSSNASYTISKAPVTITTQSATKTYDGTALTAADVTVEGMVEYWQGAYTEDQMPVVTATGSQTDAGSSTNTYSIDWREYNENNYTITENLGTLTVTPLDVEIRMLETEEPFDNSYHRPKYEVISNGEVSIDTTTYTPSVHIANAMFQLVFSPENLKYVGSTETTATVEWAYGNQANFNITVTDGSLTVTPIPMTIATGSASKVYDGTPLMNSDVTITCDNNVGISASANGMIYEVGSVDNTYTLSGSDFAENYVITDELGTLTVEPLQLSFSLGGTTTTYNSGPASYGDPKLTYLNGPHAGETVTAGTYIRNIGSTEATFEMYTGETVTLTATGYPYKDVGEYPLNGVCVFSGSESNYTVAYTNTQCVVNPASITVTTDSETKVFDGTPLPVNTSAPISGNLYDYTVYTSVTGSQTDVGSSPNTYEIHWSGIDPNNYTVTENLGTLTVTPLDVVIYVTGGSYVYDAQYHAVGVSISCDNESYTVEKIDDNIWRVTWDWGDAFDITVAYSGATDAGTYNLNSYYYFLNGNESNYHVSIVGDETLEITPRSIVINLCGDYTWYQDPEGVIPIVTTAGYDGVYCEFLSVEYLDPYINRYYQFYLPLDEDIPVKMLVSFASNYWSGGAAVWQMSVSHIEWGGGTGVEGWNPDNFTITTTNSSIGFTP